jgi:hypothetical protein
MTTKPASYGKSYGPFSFPTLGTATRDDILPIMVILQTLALIGVLAGVIAVVLLISLVIWLSAQR